MDRLRQSNIYPCGAIVFLEGDQPRGAYCVCGGRVKLSSVSSDGRGVIFGIVSAGEVLGVRSLLSGRPHDLTAETLERTQLCFISRDEFLRFLHHNGDVSLRLAQRLSNELYDAYYQVRGAVLQRSDERLTELLLVLCETHGKRTGEGISITSNLSQQELAEMIGVSRRSLTRTLARLKRLRIIECQRRHILIRDVAALRNWLSAQ
ncbi:MAG: Crp/Fnr family transcriptional regulator, partial [Acidobacteriota bacterium]